MAAFSSNIRNQWQGTGTPYQTGYMSGEVRLLKNKLENENRLGIGFAAMYDQSLNGGLKTNMASLTAAYTINLSGNGSGHWLGLGFGLNQFNRRVDFSRLSFQQQFIAGGFDANLPSGEMNIQGLKNFFDISTGLTYTFTSDNLHLNAGSGVFHVNEPRQTFTGDSVERVRRRYSNHILLSTPIAYDKDFQFHFLHSRQGNIQETTIGSGLTWLLSESAFGEKSDLELETLLFYRFKDAVYPYVGLIYNGFYVGLSYDATVSSLSSMALRNRSFELSLRYYFRGNEGKPDFLK